MQFQEMPFEGAVPIDAYGPGFTRVGGERYDGPVVVFGAQVLPWGGLEDADTLLGLSGQVDVVLVGMGAEIAHLPKPLRTALDAGQIGAEVMNTPTACRTYNVLASEGRRVAAALVPMPSPEPKTVPASERDD